jgi:DNA-binding MarR family transcriptional regulator
MVNRDEIVSRIRGFNRFYTNILGLLDMHILNSGYSLTEARILFDLNETERCTANTLSAKLKIDKSYLSRILARFEKNGLISKEVSCDDSRFNFILLSKRVPMKSATLSKNPTPRLDSCFQCSATANAVKFTRQ